MMTETLFMCGLRIRTELPLHQSRHIADPGEYDVDIAFGPRVPVRSELPAGRVVVHVEIDRPYLTCTATADGGYLARFYGTCDFVVDRDLRRVRVDMVEGGNPDMAAVYAAGTFLSFLLGIRGVPVLHASAVQIGDHAVAFVGRSGMGKSTMATLMCRDGAELITDDVLRLDLDAEDITCRLGATELRLRKSAEELSAGFGEESAIRLTVDARSALAVTAAHDDRLPLAAIVIPVPDRERDECEITRLAPLDAAVALTQFPRVLGWEDPVVLQRHLQQLVHIVERVPVCTARVPWGPPFRPEIAAEIRAAVDALDRRSQPGLAISG